MKKSDFQQLKTKNPKELLKKATEEKKELTTLLMERSMGKLKNMHKIGFLKKDIARIMTVLKLKEIEGKSEKESAADKGGKK